MKHHLAWCFCCRWWAQYTTDHELNGGKDFDSNMSITTETMSQHCNNKSIKTFFFFLHTETSAWNCTEPVTLLYLCLDLPITFSPSFIVSITWHSYYRLVRKPCLSAILVSLTNLSYSVPLSWMFLVFLWRPAQIRIQTATQRKSLQKKNNLQRRTSNKRMQNPNRLAVNSSISLTSTKGIPALLFTL